jgi:hypothetical protein
MKWLKCQGCPTLQVKLSFNTQILNPELLKYSINSRRSSLLAQVGNGTFIDISTASMPIQQIQTLNIQLRCNYALT